MRLQLHPNILLLYTISILTAVVPSFVAGQTTTVVETVSASTVTVSSTASPSSDVSFTSSSAFENATLTMHNYYRYRYNASDVSWNSSLANYAGNYAGKCVWQHSGGPDGENLAYGYPTASDAITAWANESSSYDYSDPGFSETTGHFTQLVWQATTSIGCGRYNCNGAGGISGWYVVCEYYPPGNVIGEFATEVSRPANYTGSSSSSSASSTSSTPTPSSTGHKSGAEKRIATCVGLAELVVGVALGVWAWGS